MLRLTALATCLALPAAAQDPAWPDEFTGMIDEARSYCDGEFSVYPETVVQRDLNGDGTPDWLLDTAGFTCATNRSLYCGTEGCGIETLIDGELGALTLRSWDVENKGGTTYLTAPNDRGETVRFLWSGSEWVLQ